MPLPSPGSRRSHFSFTSSVAALVSGAIPPRERGRNAAPSLQDRATPDSPQHPITPGRREAASPGREDPPARMDRAALPRDSLTLHGPGEASDVHVPPFAPGQVPRPDTDRQPP